MSLSISSLTLAFRAYMLEKIANADNIMLDAERAVLARKLSLDALTKEGLTSKSQLEHAAIEAFSRLPVELDFEERMDLLREFVQLALVDDELHREESQMLVHASRLLEVPVQKLFEHLDEIPNLVGALDDDILLEA